ncbi:phosphocholine-specific phospholipase C [Streptomyces sp. H27-D2]|uniref:phosphocholine-specific phospholipase C n=1 Tax=Streptomyces sp. H27-D2 TaxID=3046304 RepID=UPI002DB9F989|nr:phospholipase C, phosphocholine-specific [Streptomyces sp. H27-D2]MEC4016241.1 phospholipase C, phosphocholine-specific [Streptomyces sp. H27-D2]
MTTDISRRRMLALGGGAVGAAAAGSLLPPSLQQALAAEPAAGAAKGIGDIRHVVILMQENRSFDHYYGSLRGVRGFGDRNAIRLPGGKSVFEQPGALGVGTVLPFPVREAAEAQHKDLQYIGDLDHSWSGGAKAWNDGWMNNWVTAKTGATLAFYDRRDLPFHYELADTFTICDAYHSSIHSSTSPNRNHLVSGWTGFEPGTGKRAVGNDAYSEGTHTGYTWTTYPERLEAAGVSWKVYQEWENFTDNNLEFYASFKAVARKALAKAGDFAYMEAFYAKVRDAASEAERTRLLGLLDEGVATLSRAERSLFERALRRGRTDGLADAFRADVAAGKLPKVSYLVPSAVDSEHPGASSPIASATITYKILDALASNPEVWRHTAVFLTYDENDGFYDHVPPPVPAAGTEGEFWEGKPTGLGMRVPMTVVSPWTVGGFACSQVFDHTSITRFMETWLGVREPNISAWRRTVCGDLTSAFDFSRGRRQPSVDRPGAIPAFTGRWRPAPPADQRLPEQEHGHRPARPLPYQPDAYGRFDARAGVFRLALRNTGRAAAHLALYPYAGEYATPQHREVLGRAEWDVPVKDGAYRFTLTGPNGFRREFAGTGDGAAAALEVAGRVEARHRELHLTLTNRGRRTLTLTLRADAYSDARKQTLTLRPGASRTLPVAAERAHGWYDVSLTAAEDASFARRLMGHIENGRASVTG